MFKSFLVLIGLRSKCCKARKVFVPGWDWKDDRNVCEDCGKTV